QTQGLPVLAKGGQEPVGLFPCELNHTHLRHHDRPTEDRGDGQAQKHHLSRDRRVLEGKNESAGREKMQRGNQLRHSALVIAELARNESAESCSQRNAIVKMRRGELDARKGTPSGRTRRGEFRLMGCLKNWRGMPIADLAYDDKGQPDRDKEEGEELAASKSQDRRRIRLAEK